MIEYSNALSKVLSRRESDSAVSLLESRQSFGLRPRANRGVSLFPLSKSGACTYSTPRFLAQREGFEPPDSCPSTVFKTAAFDRSAISAYILSFYVSGRMRSVRRTEARSACRSAISAFKVQLFYQTKGGLSIKFTFCFGR